MGTVGHNDPRDNWFWSDGALDNQAWDNAISVAATGRITQLTAYMAGDLGAIHGGPTLHAGAGGLLLYTEQPIARRSAPYTGGFDGTGRNANDGYYINVYGFNYVFTNPTSFIVGAFRRSGDSWILGFDDHDPNFGHLKTVGGSTPAAATGGNAWSTEAAGYSGGVMAYASYVPLGMFARVAGVFVPVTGKRFHDTTTTYFATILADAPLHYFRLDESGAPYLDYGSLAIDGSDSAYGSPVNNQSALIVDADKAAKFNTGGGIDVVHPVRGAGINDDCGPVNLAFEFWVKTLSSGWNFPGFGDVAASIIHAYVSPAFADSTQEVRITHGTDIFWHVTSQPFGAPAGTGGLEEGDQGTVVGALTIGTVHHVVVKYQCGSGFTGDHNPIATGGSLDVYVDGVSVAHYDLGSYRPFIFSPSGNPDTQMQIGHWKPWDSGNNGNDSIMDEIAIYGNYTPGLDPLTPAQIAHHYAVGTGSSGGTVAIGATYYVRNDANTAWIALNMAALRGWMPERREFKVREVWPDGSYRDLLGRWGEEETFGFTKRGMQQRQSGLVIPRQFATA